MPAGGNLQAAINAANPGDTITLAAGAVYAGSFVLPAKSGSSYITIRSSTPDAQLPADGVRDRTRRTRRGWRKYRAGSPGCPRS